MIKLLHGDCREVLKTLADNSVDSIVTDPPYLIEFMGKRWDQADAALGASPFDAWFSGFCAGEACFRVQAHKEGRYYTCTLSIHLRADDAPVLVHLQRRLGGRITFGDGRENKQGVKSAPDVRWVVDARDDCLRVAACLDRVPMFAKKARDYALWRRALHLWETTPKGGRWTGPRDVTEMASLHRQLQEVKRYDGAFDLDLDPFMPPSQAFHYGWAKEALRVLKPGGFLVAFGGTRTFHRLVCAIEDGGFEVRDMLAWLYGSGFPKGTDRAKIPAAWAGWNTALKPGLEPICLARRPMDGTLAENLQRWGTGALNIDGCRLDGVKGVPASPARKASGNALSGSVDGSLRNCTGSEGGFDPNLGRWPANVVHDGSAEVLALFPDAPGQQADTSTTAPSPRTSGIYGRMNREGEASADSDNSGAVGFKMKPGARRADVGSAARFFYCAKADAADRNDGLAGQRNGHPTVKPTDLMRWLVRLVTPPGGVVLDPFLGSGSTLKAAELEGFSGIGIEREAEYLAIAQQRIAADAPLFRQEVA